MSGPGVSRPDDLAKRIRAVREQFAASGVSITKWAMERRLNPAAVHNVLTGKRPCVRGESHRIAVALGVKDEIAPPGTSTAPTAERVEGMRG